MSESPAGGGSLCESCVPSFASCLCASVHVPPGAVNALWSPSLPGCPLSGRPGSCTAKRQRQEVPEPSWEALKDRKQEGWRFLCAPVWSCVCMWVLGPQVLMSLSQALPVLTWGPSGNQAPAGPVQVRPRGGALPTRAAATRLPARRVPWSPRRPGQSLGAQTAESHGLGVPLGLCGFPAF